MYEILIITYSAQVLIQYDGDDYFIKAMAIGKA